MRFNGFVYLILSEDQGVGKIGWSGDDPRQRLMKLQTGNPCKLTLDSFVMASTRVEGVIQSELSAYRRVGEWFENIPLLRAVFACLAEDSINADDEDDELTPSVAAETVQSGMDDFLHGQE